jgi:hypothetical protein
MVDDGKIPSFPVGKGKKVDPLDAIVHVLAGKEGVSREEFWRTLGEAVPDLARAHYAAILTLQAAA